MFARNKPELPAVTLTRGKDVEVVSAELAELVRLGWAVKQAMDIKAAELKPINERLLTTFGPGAKIQIARQCSATLTEQIRWAVADVSALRNLLGPRFDDLVIASYRPEPKLIELAGQEDEISQRILA